MKNKYILCKSWHAGIICLTIIAASLSSCIQKFDEMRVKPEGVNSALPSSFLSNSIYSAVTTLNYQGHDINDQLAQVSVDKTTGDQIHRYTILPGIYGNMWNSLYGPMADIQEMLKLAISSGNHNYMAIAYTLEAWIMSNITDIYGDVPFTEALKGMDGNVTPAFDPQQQIYDSILVYLGRANDLYDLNTALTGEDILYSANTSKSNVMKWKKFTNALHLRLLMRVERKSSGYQQQLHDLLADPNKYPLMASVGDGATLFFTNITPFLNTFYNQRDVNFNSEINFSAYFMDYLSGVDDPRLPVWASKVNGSYVGVPTGFSYTDQTIVLNTAYSSFLIGLKTSKYFGDIMQYSEQEFLLAEACLKGYMADDAKTHYENGIKASMSYWGVTAIPDDFWQNAKIAYDGTLEQIITQKYFALFGNGFQQWFEYRRTGYPVLQPGEEMDNNGKMPQRIPYPTVESIYNKKNYDAAVARMGGDDINTKVWWEK